MGGNQSTLTAKLLCTYNLLRSRILFEHKIALEKSFFCQPPLPICEVMDAVFLPGIFPLAVTKHL